VAGCCHPDVVGAGGEPGGDGTDRQAGANERVQVFGTDGVWVRAGPGDAVGPRICSTGRSARPTTSHTVPQARTSRPGAPKTSSLVNVAFTRWSRLLLVSVPLAAADCSIWVA
jgi:hypothetical protein